jgi:superfamily II DNA or RNA helicase
MSLKTSLSNLSDETVEKIRCDLQIEIVESKGNKYKSFGPKKYIFPYELYSEKKSLEDEEKEDVILLPFAYAHQTLNVPRPKRLEKSGINVAFTSVLRDEQVKVKQEAISILNKTGSVIISAACGFGKTILSINLCCCIKLATLIVVNKIVLMKQWEESILKFCPEARVKMLKPSAGGEELDSNFDFYIINAVNIPKMRRGFFARIQCLVLDEVHLLMAEKLSTLTMFVQPRYSIGLSATPYRMDSLNILLDLFFGPHKIVRELNHKHTLYTIKTGFKPVMELTKTGGVNWSSVLESQSEDMERNKLIVRIATFFSSRVFLILVKRVKQGHLLVSLIQEAGVSVTSLLGSSQEFDAESRVLVGTTQKVGVGFDHPKLDALILACDIEDYFIQYLARVFRRPDSTPMIFDLLDDNPILKKHFRTREKVSLEHGGCARSLNDDFPNFFKN